MDRIINFLKEVRVELSKVSWPSRQQTINYTMVVIVIALFLAVYLGALDYFYEYLLNKLIS